MAALATRIIRSNGLSDKITVINKLSSEVCSHALSPLFGRVGGDFVLIC